MPELTDFSEVMKGLQTYQEQVAKAMAEAKSYGQAQSDTLEKLERIQKQIDSLTAELHRPSNGAGPTESKSLGEVVVNAPEIQEFLKKPWHKGGSVLQLPRGYIWGAPPKIWPEMKTITEAAVGFPTPGILTVQRVVDEIIKPPQRRVRLRDLIPRAPTTTGMVDYVRENVFTSTASPVQEASSKPFSTITFTDASATVRTIAHWMAATKQVLDDFTQLGAYINTRLIDGILDAEDSELLFGDNTGQHLNGIDTQATAYSGVWNVAGDTYIDRLAHALQELENTNYMVDGIVLHPLDWRKITLVKTEDGGTNKGTYIMGGPATTAAPQLWGIPVALTTAQRVGRFLVGQFLGSAMIFDRMEPRVSISTEHADYFVQNRVAILAEERICLCVFRPAAFRTGAF